MTKKRFRTFPLDDLTWGLNLRDYPSEIEDKQMLQIDNFNFEWNKLVSSKWIDRIYNSTFDNLIQGITTDWDDVWHIEWGNLYKNWDAEYLSNAYRINVTWINNDWFDIEIDWYRYIFDKSVLDDSTAMNLFVSDLQTLLWSEYDISADWAFQYVNINKTDGSPINFTKPNLIKTIDIDTWWYWSWIDITIDWVNIKANHEDYNSISELYDYIVSQLPVWVYTYDNTWLIRLYRNDLEVPVITYNNVTHYSYTVRAPDFDNPSWYNVWWTPPTTRDVNTYYVQITLDWTDYKYTYPNWIEWNTYSFNTTIPYRWNVAHYSNDSVWTIPFGNFYDYINWWWIDYQIVSPAAYYDFWSLSINEYTFAFRRNDWAQVSYDAERVLVIDENLNLRDYSPTSNMFITSSYTVNVTVSDWADITWTTTNIWLWLISDDLYDITVSNIWTLIVSKRGFSPVFIDLDGNVYEISAQDVWQPTVGTIYQWKIILWWYEWRDTIFFSKSWTPDIVIQSDPVQDGDWLNFWTYSAWSQSISGGNKWTITWFKVGENWLYVFKEEEIWYTNSDYDSGPDAATPTYNFIFQKITSNWAINQASIADVWQDIFYFDYKNRAVRRLSYEQNLTTLRDVNVSDEIKSVFDEMPDKVYPNSTLISTSFTYPYYDIHIFTDSSEIFELVWNNEWRYKIPNKTLSYNVDNKSWVVRTDKDNLGVLHAFKWVFATIDGDIYKDHIWNTLEEGVALSKEYTFKDDVDWKFYGEIELVWDIEPEEWEEKTLTLEVLVDWETIELENSLSPNIITFTKSELTRLKNRLELYDAWQTFQFRLKHSWTWKVVISDIYIKWRPDLAQEEYY